MINNAILWNAEAKKRENLDDIRFVFGLNNS